MTCKSPSWIYDFFISVEMHLGVHHGHGADGAGGKGLLACENPRGTTDHR